MSSDAKTAFDQNIQRAGFFLDIHKETQPGAGAPTNARRELPRGAVVFAVGAFDAYLSDVTAEVLVTQLREGMVTGDSRNVLQAVCKELPTLAVEVALREDPEDRITQIQGAIVEHFQTQVSGHGPKAVTQAVQRMGGSTSTVWDHASSPRMKSPQAELERWSNVRHRIVHRGERVSVRRPSARKCIRLIEALVEGVEKVADDAGIG